MLACVASPESTSLDHMLRLGLAASLPSGTPHPHHQLQGWAGVALLLKFQDVFLFWVTCQYPSHFEIVAKDGVKVCHSFFRKDESK